MNAAGAGFLVTSGYNGRAVLAFCRLLRACGVPYALVAASTDDPILLTSHRDRVVLTRADRTLRVEDYERAAALARQRDGPARWVLAPTSEFLNQWALAHRAELEAAAVDLPLPSAEAYRLVSDKDPFAAHCRALGLSVPRRFSTLAEAGLPCVAKPCANIGADGVSRYPILLHTQAEAEAFARRPDVDAYFFQEFIPGESHYLLYHIRRDGTHAAWSQRNLAQQPGGKSIVWAVPSDLHRAALCGRWAQALVTAGFHGLAMIELKGAGEKLTLIEANPRLWGPLQLCVDHAPALLAGYVGDCVGRPIAAPKPRTGYDYLWLGGVLEARRSGRPLAWHPPLAKNQTLRMLLSMRSDVFLRSDSLRWFLRETLDAPHAR